MKACLVLTDAGSTRFWVREATAAARCCGFAIRGRTSSAAWIWRRACLDQFGLTAVNLNARSVIHAIAYYFKHREIRRLLPDCQGS